MEGGAPLADDCSTHCLSGVEYDAVSWPFAGPHSLCLQHVVAKIMKSIFKEDTTKSASPCLLANLLPVSPEATKLCCEYIRIFVAGACSLRVSECTMQRQLREHQSQQKKGEPL